MEYSGYYVFDAEATGLDKGGGRLSSDTDEVHCVVLKDLVSEESFHFDKFTGWEEMKEVFGKAKMVVGHNIIDFDLPMFKRVLGVTIPEHCIVVDTLVWSRALYPDRKLEGGHGLAAWAKRNGMEKPEIEDWSQYTPEILNRCYEDVENNAVTYQKLLQEARMYDSGNFLRLEQKEAEIISRQSKRGHAFNKPLAEWLVKSLTKWLSQIDEALSRHMKPKPKLHNMPLKKIRVKNGDYTKDIYSWFEEDFEKAREVGPVQPHKGFSVECDPEAEEALCRVIWPEINFGSDKQVLAQFQSLGYQAVEFTDKGNPQITDESFGIKENEHLKILGQQYTKRRQVSHRLSMVKGWLADLDEDGRIRGEVNPQGAVTLRMTHRKVVNVPKFDPKERWSEYYRACFCSTELQPGDRDYDLEWEFDRPTFKEDEDGEMITEKTTVKGRMAMVGCDAKGLENRMIAHWLNNPELTEKIIKDFHTLIWKSVEYYLKSRNSTKNWEYAYFFGARDLKLGTMLDHVDEVTEEEAIEAGYREITRGQNEGLWKGVEGKPIPWRLVKYAVCGARSRKMIEKEIPEMGALVADVTSEAKQGFITLFDGRRLIMRRGWDGAVMEHKALNTRIQGAGALIMKAASVILDVWCKQKGLEVYFLNHVHDEIQVECYPSDRKEVAFLMRESIRWAGRKYNLNVELDGDAKIGTCWAHTH